MDRLSHLWIDVFDAADSQPLALSGAKTQPKGRGILTPAWCAVSSCVQLLDAKRHRMLLSAKLATMRIHVPHYTGGAMTAFGDLGWAADRGELHTCKFILALYPPDIFNVTMGMDGYNSMLVSAATHGHMHILQFLKDQGYMPYSGEYAHGSWAIRCAAANGHLDVLQFLRSWRLVKSEAFVSAKSEAFVQRLPWLSRYPPPPKLTALDVQSKDNYALMIALQKGHIHVAQFLNDWIKEAQ